MSHKDKKVIYCLLCLPTSGEPVRKMIEFGDIETDWISEEIYIETTTKIIGNSERPTNITTQMRAGQIKIDAAVCAENRKWAWVNTAFGFKDAALYKNKTGILSYEVENNITSGVDSKEKGWFTGPCLPNQNVKIVCDENGNVCDEPLLGDVLLILKESVKNI